ncbi:putative histidine protein kinase [Streptomyces bingchenggensis BCW-1]|uniref:Putative histidine protein kinase n=1 Tax=Streptomyces bingchenggensis (strain BCW-1) TaxID=749414 RepID=D7CG96_STRBB|nr:MULTISPECIES: PAS domain S-box protein [Streptomyces]ADI09000.1 putative histidine protein kinase [Streptomyces bingchenggensis BCW-1]
MRDDRIRVVVADDDPVVREALADLVDSHPDLALVGLAVNHEQAVRAAVEHRPRVVVMDVHMPKGDAPSSVRAIREQVPGARVVALSAHGDRETVLNMLAVGATGYLVKGTPAEEILEAITRAARDQFSMAGELVADCTEPLRRADRASWRFEELVGNRLEESYLELLGQAPCGVLIVGARGRIESANAHARHMFGYSSAELRDKRLRDLVPDRYRTAAEQLLGRQFTAPSAMTGRRRDGTEFPAQFSGGHLQGRRPRCVVFVADLSQLRAAEGRFRQVIESSPDAMVIVDAAGRIQTANRRTEALFGYDRDQLIGRAVEALLPDQPLTISLRDWADSAEEPMGHSMELVGRRSDAKQFPADVSIIPLRTEDGLLTVLAIKDITEVQRAQFVLERSLELLEVTDRDRQALLSHLVHAQEAERGRIAADIHDDTIQVITAASLRLQQLRRRLRDPDEQRIMEKLDETLKLSLSRLRQLIFDLRPSSLEHGCLAAALRGLLEQIRTETGVEYRLEDRIAAKPPPETMALIYRTAQEALMNVRKHARAKTVHVQLLGLDEGCLVRIVDDGQGYNPLEVESRPGHLGLSLIQERAQIAGGWCRIESAPGAGTTVEFWVPLGETPGHGPLPFGPADTSGFPDSLGPAGSLEPSDSLGSLDVVPDSSEAPDLRDGPDLPDAPDVSNESDASALLDRPEGDTQP